MRAQSLFRRSGLALAAAGAVAVSLVLAGCSGGSSGTSDSGGEVTLRLATFGDSAAVKRQAAAYEKANPNVTVQVNTVANAEDARTSVLTKLAAGSGLADVEQIEISWTGQLARYKSRFVPLETGSGGPFVAAQTTPVELSGGKVWALGIGTGPSAVCYREDLLQKAGLPTDEASIDSMFASWDSYFAAGEKYAAGGGEGKWYDDSYLLFNAQVEQMRYPYEKPNGDVVVDNTKLEKVFKDTMELAPRLSANLVPFSEDWNAGMGNGSFATLACPSWLLNQIKGNAPNVTGWRVANAFPGGGANVGGSFFAVPTQSKNQDAAAKLASYLSAPTQQIDAFKAGSAFPSREKALNSAELREVTNPYFGDSKVGAAFADRSKAATVAAFKGPRYLAIDTAAFNAIGRIESGKQSIDAGWKQFVSESESAKK